MTAIFARSLQTLVDILVAVDALPPSSARAGVLVTTKIGAGGAVLARIGCTVVHVLSTTAARVARQTRTCVGIGASVTASTAVFARVGIAVVNILIAQDTLPATFTGAFETIRPIVSAQRSPDTTRVRRTVVNICPAVFPRARRGVA
jgi:hypothetical protein